MIAPQLSGKIALITGANNTLGIGAAMARGLAAQGADVFITYYQPDDQAAVDAPSTESGEARYRYHSAQNADAILDQLRAFGVRAEGALINLADPFVIAPLFDQVERTLGAVDILIHNAAHSTADTFLPANSALVNQHSVEWLSSGVPTLTAESHDAHFAVNTRAGALLITEYARRTIARRATSGRVITISTDGAPAFPSELAYGASKYALESYSRAAALELGQFGITVNVISPGPTQTGWITPHMEQAIMQSTPLRRVGLPEDIADVAVFLASHQARWITGQVIHVNGGHSV